MRVDAVIVAAGSSTRFGERNKLFEPLLGVPVLGWSLRAFSEAHDVGRVVVVGRPEDHSAIAAVAREHAPGLDIQTIAGGERRRDSVKAGVSACETRYVAIHDGARPLVDAALIARVVAAAEDEPGAIAATRVVDTIKEVDSGRIQGHPERSRLWAAQTPQVVLRQAWLDAAAIRADDETDDAAMLHRLGMECVVVESDATNLKITRPADLRVAEAFLRERQA